MSVTRTRTRVTSDPELFAGMAAGDERALAALYDRYGAVVYSLAHAMTGDSSAAEDVAAEVFARAWREARRFADTRGTALAWLTSLTRERAREQRQPAQGPAQRFAGSAEGRVERSAILQALGELSEAQRQVVELAFLGGMTVRDLAGRLGVSESSAGEQLKSAMNSLRRAVGPRDASLERAMAIRV